MNTGAEAELGEVVVEAFRAGLRGQLLRPGEDGYDVARKVFNGMIDRRPALIARCAGVADVIHCVNFARAHHLLVAVRGGGNFGVVTSFEYQLHRVGPVLSGVVIHPFENAKAVLTFYRDRHNFTFRLIV